MNDLEMNGLGHSGGGAFNEVRLAGIHRIYGEVKCKTFESDGVAKCDDKITADRLSIAGVTKVVDLNVNKISVEGVLKSSGALSCESLSLEGYLSTVKSFKTKKANLMGKFKFRGEVEAEELVLMVAAKSSFTEVGATQIFVTKVLNDDSWTKRLNRLFQKNACLFVGQLIEGEEIYLEYCRVQSVFGDHVKIGSYCIINEVEYKETIDIHPTAVVKHQKRV